MSAIKSFNLFDQPNRLCSKSSIMSHFLQLLEMSLLCTFYNFTSFKNMDVNFVYWSHSAEQRYHSFYSYNPLLLCLSVFFSTSIEIGTVSKLQKSVYLFQNNFCPILSFLFNRMYFFEFQQFYWSVILWNNKVNQTNFSDSSVHICFSFLL